MNLLDTLTSAGGGDLMKQLSGQFGLTPGDATSAFGAFAPLLAGGLKEKLTGGGSPALMDMLTSGTMEKYSEDPASLATPAAAEQGNSLLSSIFGGGDAVSGIVSAVAGKTGIGAGVIQKMLPIVLTLLTSLLAKHAKGDPSALMSSLDGLSGDHHGIFDAVKGMAAKIFG